MITYRLITLVVLFLSAFALASCQMETKQNALLDRSLKSNSLDDSSDVASIPKSIPKPVPTKAIPSGPVLNLAWRMEDGIASGSIGHVLLGSQSKWRTTLKTRRGSNAFILTTPVISSSTLFALDVENEVYALDLASGKRLWSIKTPFDPDFSSTNQSRVSLALGVGKKGKEILFVAKPSGTLAALDTSSRKWLWQRETVLGIGSHLLPVGDKVLFVDLKGILRAIDADMGDKLWEGEQEKPLSGKRAVYSDLAAFGEYVSVVTNDVQLYRVDLAKNGALVWQVSILPAKNPSLVLSRHAVFVSGTRLSRYAAKNGQLLWQQKDQKSGAMVVSGDTLFAVSESGLLEARSTRNGQLIWKKHSNARPDKPYNDLLLAAGRLHLVSQTGYVTSYYAEDGERAKVQRLTGAPASKLIVVAGRIYAATKTGDVIAF